MTKKVDIHSYSKGVKDVSEQVLRILTNPEFDENICLWQIEEAVIAHLNRVEKIKVSLEEWA